MGPGSGSGGSDQKHTPDPATRVKHVFVIELATPSYQAAFGKGSVATYLDKKLRPRGELLSQYRSLGSSPLPDRLAMISGQAPNADTVAGCTTYSEFSHTAAPGKTGQVPGSGCIYPTTALTIGDQLDGVDTQWRAYADGMTAPCQHPNSGAADPSPDSTGSGYATSENPFVYFHSLLDLGDCQSDDVPLTRLAHALKSKATTPGYSFIAPDPCDAGIDATCPDGKPGGLVAADAFLRRVVPGILASAAYKRERRAADPVHRGRRLRARPERPRPPPPAPPRRRPRRRRRRPPVRPRAAPGPVRTGALVLSHFTTAGSTDARRYNPYSVLRSLEQVFGLSSLAHARSASSFADYAFSR